MTLDYPEYSDTDNITIQKLNAENTKLNEENAKILATIISLHEEINQLKLKLKNHEDRILKNAEVLM